MPKKSYTAKKRTTYKRRPKITKRSRSVSRASAKRKATRANRMQSTAYSWVKKKYTFVTPLRIAQGQSELARTICHVGNENQNTPGACYTLTNADPDGIATEDMKLYQFFRITGVAFKLFWPEGTDPESTPVQWSMAYSPNVPINPNVTAGVLQSVANFQTSACSAKVPVKRYFKTASTLKRLGIDWCSTDEYADFGNVGQDLYGGQLLPDSGSSTSFRVYRSGTSTQTSAEIGRLQLTYYIQYKGTKGVSPLI